jgi:hypothetical protein
MRRAVLVFVCCLTVLFTGLILHGHSEAASGRGKSVSSNLLPMELKNLNIKDDFIPYAGKEAGVIKTLIGHLVVTREDMRQAYFAAAGDKLYEKDVLFTLKKSQCRFKLHNEDTVSLGENAKIGITASSYDRKTQIKRSAFDMAKGKAMFFTLRLFKHKGTSMTVSTPTAVAGVRGTKFGVDVIELGGTPSASLPVLVAGVSDTGFRHLAQASAPPLFETNIYTYEGVVDVTSRMTGQTSKLGAGQGINAGGGGLGNLFPMTPDIYRKFQADTEGSPPGDDKGATGGPGGIVGTDPGMRTPNIIDTSKITQDQGTKDLKPPPTPIPIPHQPGYPPGGLY